jgi:hypothetical protein
MITTPMEAREKGLDVWAAAYTYRWKIFPRKVVRITKKFLYFDEENEKDRIEHYKFKNSEVAGLWTSETEAWRHIAKRCGSDIEWARELITDYEMVKETHPEAVI